MDIIFRILIALGLQIMRHSSSYPLGNTLLNCFSDNQIEDPPVGINNASVNRFTFLFPVSLIRKKYCFLPDRHQAHPAVGPVTLLHGKALFVIPATDSDHTILPLFNESISRTSVYICFLYKAYSLCSLCSSKSFWQPVTREEKFSFILTQPTI